MSCHWCSVAVNPLAPLSRLSYSRCSSWSVTAGASPGRGSGSGGISASGSSWVACSNDRDREDLASEPAARSANSLAASRPGPHGAARGTEPGTESQPPGGAN